MTEPSDDDLVERCLAAKQAATEAFDALYHRHAPALLAFLCGMHRGDEHAARDALQETFYRFYVALPSFERGRPVRPWLYRIARNVSLDYLKRRSTREERPTEPGALGGLAGRSAEAEPAEAVAEREAASLLRRAVLDLPPDELAVFLLKHDQGRTYGEAAEALSCSVRTAKYRMKSALQRLGREAERLGVEA